MVKFIFFFGSRTLLSQKPNFFLILPSVYGDLPWCLPAGRQGGIGRPACGRQARWEKVLNMIYVYAISSIGKNYIYIGLTSDLNRRLEQHNSGKERTTRSYKPFELIFSEVCKSRPEARTREKYWKSGIGKEKLKELRTRLEKE